MQVVKNVLIWKIEKEDSWLKQTMKRLLKEHSYMNKNTVQTISLDIMVSQNQFVN